MMVYGTTAPDPSFRGFTKPPKTLSSKEKKKVYVATIAQIIFLDWTMISEIIVSRKKESTK